jgi:UV DNA damage endonuclease
MRLGFVVKPLARPELKSHDSRRWQNSPHLSVSLAYLRDVMAYLAHSGVAMYRMSSSLAPYATHPDMPQFSDQIAVCAEELAQAGQFAQENDLRLSIHAGQYTIPNATEGDLEARHRAEASLHAALLDGMGLGPEAVVVTHVGGIYGDRAAARERFVNNHLALPAPARARLVLENDDTRFSVADILWVHRATGIRLIFDYLHYRLNNPERLSLRETLAACLATWPPDQTPKVHFSSPRTEWLAEEVPAGAPPRLRKARWGRHSDYVNPFEFEDFLRAAEGLRPFDIMLEVRGRDLALFQLRADLAVFAPDLAAQIR